MGCEWCGFLRRGECIRFAGCGIEENISSVHLLLHETVSHIPTRLEQLHWSALVEIDVANERMAKHGHGTLFMKQTFQDTIRKLGERITLRVWVSTGVNKQETAWLQSETCANNGRQIARQLPFQDAVCMFCLVLLEHESCGSCVGDDEVIAHEITCRTRHFRNDGDIPEILAEWLNVRIHTQK